MNKEKKLNRLLQKKSEIMNINKKLKLGEKIKCFIDE